MSVLFTQADNDYVRTATTTFGLDGAFSVAGWVRAGGNLAPLGPLVASGATQMIFGVKDTLKLYATINDDSLPESTDSVPSDAWVHIAMTYDDTADEVRFYIGGNLDSGSPVAFTTVMTEGTTRLTVGRRSGADRWDGHLEDVAIWNRRLSAQEIASAARGRLVAGFLRDGLTGWWPLHAPGDAVFDNVAAGDLGLQDFSGNGTPADDFINGSPEWSTDVPGLHWATAALVIPGAAGIGPALRRVSLGSTFIESARVVLVG